MSAVASATDGSEFLDSIRKAPLGLLARTSPSSSVFAAAGRKTRSETTNPIVVKHF
jgi:hypothetical protein